jgi:hypothetical protein
MNDACGKVQVGRRLRLGASISPELPLYCQVS